MAPVVVEGVTSALATPSASGSGFDVTLENRASSPQHGWLRWAVVPVESSDPSMWWRRSDDAATYRYEPVHMEPNQRAVVHADASAPTVHGTYGLRLSLDLANSSSPGQVRGNPEDVVSVFEVAP